MNRRHLLAALVLVATGGAARAQPSANAVPEAASFVRDLAQRAITTLSQAGLAEAERNRRFREQLVAGFDIRSIGMFALGRYRRQATAQEQEEFSQLYEDYIVQTYASRFVEYSGEQVQVTGSSLRGEDVFVTSNVVRPRGAEPVRVDWVLRRNAGSFKVMDVRIAGISLANTHRDEFGAVIQRGGGRVAVLIQNLRERVRR